jgi:Methyltransferase domain
LAGWIKKNQRVARWHQRGIRIRRPVKGGAPLANRPGETNRKPCLPFVRIKANSHALMTLDHIGNADRTGLGTKMTELNKMMIVNLLGRRRELKNYLEVATPSTGRFFFRIHRDYFDQTARLMYLTPYVFDDGHKIDFRSPDEDISGALEEFRQSGRVVDISLVDGWHTYKTAYRDLEQIFDLVTDGGVLVVHDCLPKSREGASPRFRNGNWWGLTYKAFLDFVLRNPSLDYFTLDCDHGCGVIIKNRAFDAVLGQNSEPGWLPSRPDKVLMERWFDAKADADLAYSLFEAEHNQLLRLVPADRFMAFFSDEAVDLARKAMDPPAPPPSPALASEEPSPPLVTEAPIPPLASAEPRRPSLDTRILRFLRQKAASITDKTR